MRCVGFLRVGCRISRPGGLKIVGETSNITAQDAADTLRVIVDLASLDTKIELRNRHMRDKYLEVEKYPKAELMVARSTLVYPAANGESEGQAKGTLRLHGASKEVAVRYSARGVGKQVAVKGTCTIKMTDFNIKVPSYLGVSVKPDVTIEIKFVASR